MSFIAYVMYKENNAGMKDVADFIINSARTLVAQEMR